MCICTATFFPGKSWSTFLCLQKVDSVSVDLLIGKISRTVYAWYISYLILPWLCMLCMANSLNCSHSRFSVIATWGAEIPNHQIQMEQIHYLYNRGICGALLNTCNHLPSHADSRLIWRVKIIRYLSCFKCFQHSMSQIGYSYASQIFIHSGQSHKAD